MFQHIMVCTDLEDGLHRLVDFVPCFVAGGAKQIVFLHVMPLLDDREIPRPDAEKMQEVREQLSVALNNVPEGVNVQVEVQCGRPVDYIVSAVKKYSIDLILLGMPSRTRLTEKLFGSTTMELCRQVSVPLMIWRPQLVSTYTCEELELRCRHMFRYLLIPYDGSNASKYLIDQIKHFADGDHNSLERCLLCWIIDDVNRQGLLPYVENQLQVAKEQLLDVKAELEALNLEVVTVVRQGNVVSEVLKLAQDYDINAIALSSDSLGKILEWSVPSFAGEILRRSWHPVVYFPPTD
ncbi:MAG: universal stress protein [Elainellaceae cyanobacterium]